MGISAAILRTTAIALVSLGLAACAPMQSRDAASTASADAVSPAAATRDGPASLLPDNVKLGVMSRFGTASLKDGIYQCADNNHPKLTLYPSCSGIPVIVLQKSTGGCLSLIPYAGLIVHSERRRTKIVWQIYGPTGYSFTDDGIELSKLNGGTLNPPDVYANKQNQGDRFKWELKQGAVFPGGMNHEAHVVDPSGVPCEPIDPVAINIID